MEDLRAFVKRSPRTHAIAHALVTRMNIALGQSRSALNAVYLRMRGSASQYGEDLLIDAILDRPTSGFYIDIGAHHPELLSNTYRFYRRGWNGINVEPSPAKFGAFVDRRSRDVNLNCAVSGTVGEITFYVLEPYFWTASREFAESCVRNGYRLVGERRVPTRTLADICAQHVGSREIDLLSCDTDGWDLDVLGSGDWTRFRPRTVLVETNIVGRSRVREMLEPKGYVYVRSTGHDTNSLFIERTYARMRGIGL